MVYSTDSHKQSQYVSMTANTFNSGSLWKATKVNFILFDEV